jgi:capsular polysaccharide biosynthesis protein
MQPPTYAAEVDLLHQPSDTSASDSIDRQLATHRVLLLRRDQLDDAARAVDRDPADLAGDIGVEVVEGSSLLRVQVVDGNRDRAGRAAALVAERYVDVADRLAPSSNIGRVQLVAPPTMLPEPVGPRPLRAAAAGALLGLVLVLAFLALVRSRDKGSRHARL